MPALPVAPPTSEEFLRGQGVFERGDNLYITSPLQAFQPKDTEIEEFAFSRQVKSQAPNENIVWLRGQYVEADRANGNGAMWKADEIALKSLTPMLMPVTVMHDPRTAVGTIADVKLLTPEKDGVPRARLDTVLALWKHRFPEAVIEAEANAELGTLMQSMECFTPWYECSECGAIYHKQPGGAEEKGWCEHLRASNPSGGFPDRAQESTAQTANASRILGDVCFTGTGLIYGTRGARGAFSDAHLERFQEELAHFHETAHQATRTSDTQQRSASHMGLVQIEQSELDTLRKERDDARAEVVTEKQARTEAEAKVETTEAEKVAAETAKAEAIRERDEEKAKTEQAALKEQRLESLGSAFTEKLESMPNVKAKLHEQAKSMSDEDWTGRLDELAELTGVKSDAVKDGESGETTETAREGEFTKEEVASVRSTNGGGGGNSAPSRDAQRSTIGKLGSVFAGSKS